VDHRIVTKREVKEIFGIDAGRLNPVWAKRRGRFVTYIKFVKADVYKIRKNVMARLVLSLHEAGHVQVANLFKNCDVTLLDNYARVTGFGFWQNEEHQKKQQEHLNKYTAFLQHVRTNRSWINLVSPRNPG
jgi:hypothetical protein